LCPNVGTDPDSLNVGTDPDSLGKSAQDLGTARRDVKFGYGLVQAKAAYDRIKSVRCGN
jgi:hypothetical protein